MHRRLVAVAIAASSAITLLAVAFIPGSAAAGSALSRPGAAQIHFLYRTKPVSEVGAPPGADWAATAASADARAFESAVLRQRYAHEGEFGSDRVGLAGTLPKATSLPVGTGGGLQASWDALNHFDNRYSDGGNQFSGEPPDQALCVNNRYVVENVNSVLQVYTPGGKALIPGQPGVPGAGPVGISVNQFFGLPSGVDRTNIVFGPFVSDPQCLYDPASHRWFVTTLELDLNKKSGAFKGPSSILIAASATSNPLGRWNVWSVDTTNNGTDGTPNHHCSSGFCFGDYPQLGIDRSGLYVTTNEFDNLGDGEFHGAQLFAISKADLASGDHEPDSQYFQNVPSATVQSLAYTLEPANGLPPDWDIRAGGTMYFGESLSPYQNDQDAAHSVALFALSNTQSLAQEHPNLQLRETSVGSERYARPLLARQKNGPMPLLHCVNLGTPCIGADYPQQRAPLPIDGSHGKFLGGWLHDGTVFLTTSTALQGSGAADYNSIDGSWTPEHQRIGVAYFALETSTSASSFSASMGRQGYVAVPYANLVYPSIAVAPNGDGVIGATLSGPTYYPSAAYATFHAGQSPTSVQIGGTGVGPYDGDSATGDGGFRPRWGDYGFATATQDGALWVAAEYVNQRCAFSKFSDDATCSNTRSFYANWGTRIMRVSA